MKADGVSDAFWGERLTVLRDLRALTQKDVADALSVNQGFLSKVEKGQRPLPDTIAKAASAHYGVPLSFFTVAPDNRDRGPVTFRKKARATVRDERRVTALYTEAARLFREVSSASSFKTGQLPDPAEYGNDPERCAAAVRAAAGFGPEDPVSNVVRMLERLGVGVVTELDREASEAPDHAGVSRPSSLNDRPLVAVVAATQGAIQRLTLGHEAGHLVFDGHLDLPVASTRSAEETRAFRFAAALLLPERVVRKRVTETLTLHGYLPIKADYGISVSAIVRRARELGVITPARYRSLNIQLSSQGWRAHEPVEVATESPILFRQALERVYGRAASARAAHQFGIEPLLIVHWTGVSSGEDEREAKDNVLQFPHRRLA